MKPGAPLLRSVRLLDQLRERIRYKHYSLRTEESYLYWVRCFVRWHKLRHPRDMGAPEIEGFLAMLATERHVSAATHNQALSALLFLYREVLDIDVPWLANISRPSSPKRIPSVLTQSEVAAVLDRLAPDIALLGRLLYGTGMRLMEGLRLRIKDVDFDRRVIVVREGKGGKDRVVMLPRSLEADLKSQVKAARCQWEVDRQAQRCGVAVPHALGAKYPGLGSRWGWFWVFPVAHAVHQPAQRRPASAPPVRGAAATRPEARGGCGRHRQAGFRPHAAPQLRHAPAAGRHRHPHGAGTAGPQRREHDHDLHPRAEDRRGRHRQPAGCAFAALMCGLPHRATADDHDRHAGSTRRR